jgi:hypothetical protein
MGDRLRHRLDQRKKNSAFTSHFYPFRIKNGYTPSIYVGKPQPENETIPKTRLRPKSATIGIISGKSSAKFAILPRPSLPSAASPHTPRRSASRSPEPTSRKCAKHAVRSIKHFPANEADPSSLTPVLQLPFPRRRWEVGCGLLTPRGDFVVMVKQKSRSGKDG